LTRAISALCSPIAPQQACRRPIHHPEQPALCGADRLRGEPVRLVVALQYGPQRFCLVLAIDEKDHTSGVDQHRQFQRNPVAFELLNPRRKAEARLPVNGAGPREERGGMAIRSHPQQHQIEARQLLWRQPKEWPQFLFILVRRFAGIRAQSFSRRLEVESGRRR
jgi:hypothetical protein